MKKIILFVAAFLAVTATQAQTQQEVAARKDINHLKKEERAERKTLRKLEGHDVSVQSKDQFSVDFGNIPNVHWKRSGYFDEAVFTQKGVKEKAYYDFNSTLVGTVIPKTFSDLPKSAQDHIRKEYKNYKIDRVILFDDNESNESDMILYGTQFDDADNYFVELSTPGKNLILMVSTDGNVSFFKEMKK